MNERREPGGWVGGWVGGGTYPVLIERAVSALLEVKDSSELAALHQVFVLKGEVALVFD